MTSFRQGRAQRGLSLLELLVAFAIMAMSVGLLYRSLGGSARSVADMVRQQQAALVAESVLALRDSVTAEGWNEVGSSAGFQWVVRSAPHNEAVAPELSAGAASGSVALDRIALHQVIVSVTWMDGARSRHLDVMTLLPQRKPYPGEGSPK